MDCEYDPTAGPSTTVLDELKDAADGRKKRRKRKNKLAEALAKKKPLFDPQTTQQTYAQYLEEYYKLDCEDVIGDMPCRFKYREVPPLDYGLTTAEIFMADDDELNRWYPLKKTLQYRQEHKQRNDQKILEAKARNIQLKMKILPSLFKRPNEEDDPSAPNEEQTTTPKKKKNKKKRNRDKNRVTVETKSNSDDPKVVKNKSTHLNDMDENSQMKSTDVMVTNAEKSESNISCNEVDKKEKKKRKRNKNRIIYESKNDANANESINVSESVIVNSSELEKMEKKKRKRNKNKINLESNNNDKSESQIDSIKVNVSESNVNLSEGVDKTEKRKRKRNKNKINGECNNAASNHKDESTLVNGTEKSINKVSKKRKCPVEDVPENSQHKKKKKEHTNDGSISREQDMKHGFGKNKKFKPEHQNNKQNNVKSDPMSKLSDERLKAFGLNPKKYRSFMKFKKY